MEKNNKVYAGSLYTLNPCSICGITPTPELEWPFETFFTLLHMCKGGLVEIKYAPADEVCKIWNTLTGSAGVAKDGSDVVDDYEKYSGMGRCPVCGVYPSYPYSVIGGYRMRHKCGDLQVEIHGNSPAENIRYWSKLVDMSHVKHG